MYGTSYINIPDLNGMVEMTSLSYPMFLYEAETMFVVYGGTG